MKKRTTAPKTLPVVPITAKQLEKQRAKDERSFDKKKSKEIEKALILKKHERLARALLLLQVLKR